MSRGDHSFARIPSAEIQRSSFDRSSGLKTTFDAGYLIPIFLDEVLPGDTFNLKMTGFARLATPIFPIMDNAFLETFWFFVPYRLLWDNWERFNGAQDNPDDSTDFSIPIVSNSPFESTVGSLNDYFGLPTEVGLNVADLCAFPYRAYNFIYNEWFRDQNLQDSVFFYTGDGPDNLQSGFSYALLRRGKRHDYFTSCLPWPQKGDAVSLPLGTSAPVVPDTGGGPTFLVDGQTVGLQSGAAATGEVLWTSAIATIGSDADWADPQLVADLTGATSATINAIRQAFQIQRLLERDARGGTRYVEVIRSHFGVINPDFRLARPEFLGSGSSPLIVSQVPQTSASETGNPLGKLAAYGTVTARNHGFTQSFTEHGLIMGLAMVRADLTYQQGLDRMWSRQTRYDFFWPALANLGEQAVLQQELFYAGVAGTDPGEDQSVFGYQERNAEYRYKPSRLTGLMRSTVSGSLDAWHLAQEFADPPVLDTDFISEDPPFDRVIAVNTEPHFIADFHFALRCARPMPVYSVPGLIDHF